MPDQTYSAPVAHGRLSARLSLPGSKSLTNRELVLAALADGAGVLRRPLRARDTALMADALRALGARIDAAAEDWTVTPLRSVVEEAAQRPSRNPRVEEAAQRPSRNPRVEEAAQRPSRNHTLHVGLAGTVMRFLPPVAALLDADTTFDGDEAARRRPMTTMTSALRALGVAVDGDALPFTVHGTGSVRGGELTIDASASSQFVSGLLLAAPRFAEGLVLRHAGGRLPSLPHIEMTIACLAARGVAVTSPDEGVWIVPPAPIRAREVTIEPDLSNASTFLAAALVAGGSVAIEGWPGATTQVGAQLPGLLGRFGGQVRRDAGALVVEGTGAVRSPGELDLSEAGELAPNLVGLAALADAPTEFTGIGHLRGHETDRLQALADDLGGLGGRVEVRPDGLLVEPAPLHGGTWRAYGDHRMATTGALVGLAVPGVEIDDIGTTDKTLPEFVDLWERLLR